MTTPEAALTEALRTITAETPGSLAMADMENGTAAIEDIARAILAAISGYQLVPVAEIERLRRIEAAARGFVALHSDFTEDCNGKCSPVAALRAALEPSEAPR